MKLGLFKLFGLEREEHSIVIFMLLQAFLIGIFYAIFNIIAHAVFLSRFDETDMARAYIFSGLAGIVLTSLYYLVKARLKFSFFSVINLFFIFLVTVCLWIVSRTDPEPLVVYLVFISLGPVFILAMLGLRSTVSGIFTLRMGERLTGMIDSGLIAGMIIGSFSVPAMLYLKIDIHNMLPVSAGSILVAFLIQMIITGRYKTNTVQDKNTGSNSVSYRVIFNNRFIKYLAVFLLLSVIVLFFVQYSFMALTRLRYPGEIEMARFLGFFEGVMMFVALMINMFLVSYIIKKQGFVVAVILTPVLIGIFTIIAIIAGSGNGFLPGAQGFLFFFLIIALSRLFSRALNITVEKTVINIMNQVTGSKLRDRLRSVFEGSMNEASVLVAGLLLVGFGALDFVKLVHFSWLLAIIIISCIIYIIFLYKKYREELLKLDGSTGTKLPGDEEDINEEYDSLSSSALFIDNNYFELITNTQLHDIITENNKMLQVIIKIAEKNHNPDILPLLKYLGSIKLTDPGLREKINSLVREMENTLEKEGFGKRKDIVSTIEGSNNRKLQLQAVLSQQAPPVVTDMMRLMRDQDIEIIRESLFIAGKFRIKELLPEICECLDNHYISRDAYSIIKSFGEEAFSAMSGHYYRSSGNIKVRRLLLRLYAESGNEQAIEFILPALWSVNRFLKRESAIGLARCGYKASSEHREKIFRELKRILGLITWNLAVRDKLKNNNSLLGEAIEEETVWWTEMIFNLLSLIYDSDSLMTIKENLGKKNLGSINCALEMVDIVVGNEVKPQLKAFINDMVPGEKARNLLRFYPGYTDENELLVQGMINMDYNHLGVWVKACALKGLYNMPRPEETDFIVALLFGVNSALREEAFRYLKDNYDDAYSGCSYRLPVTYREQLNKLLNNSNNENQYICDKLKSLSAIFPGIPKNSLVELAEKIEIISSEEISSIDAGKDFIIWPAENVDRNKDDEVFINWDITGHRFNTGEISNVHKYYYMLYIRDIELYLFYNPERSSILERYITSIYE